MDGLVSPETGMSRGDRGRAGGAVRSRSTLPWATAMDVGSRPGAGVLAPSNGLLTSYIN